MAVFALPALRKASARRPAENNGRRARRGVQVKEVEDDLWSQPDLGCSPARPIRRFTSPKSRSPILNFFFFFVILFVVVVERTQIEFFKLFLFVVLFLLFAFFVTMENGSDLDRYYCYNVVVIRTGYTS